MTIDITVLILVAAAIVVVVGVVLVARRGRGAPSAVSSVPVSPPIRPSAPPPSDATIVAPVGGAADATIVAPMSTAAVAPAASLPRGVDATIVAPTASAEATVVDLRAAPAAAPNAEAAATVVMTAAPTATLPPAPAPARGPRLTVTKGGSGIHELRSREYTLGRSSSADIVIADASVSGRHAKLSPRGDGFAISDLGSTNGTTVDGRPVRSEVQLRGGETILLGDCVLRYDRD